MPTIDYIDQLERNNTYLDIHDTGLRNSLGTASTKDVPISGDATNNEVVLGSDSRLNNAREASDVYDWAKQENKPTYTATEVGAIDITQKGVANGVAELDNTGKVPSSQLPSFVDDVIEVADYDHLPTTGESGKIYVTIDTSKTYRWTGSGYAEISESLALGETSSTAYRGDRGKTAYDHSQDSGRITSAVSSGLYKFSATAQGHISGTTAVQKSDITALGIPAQDTTYGVVSKTANGLVPQLPNETTTTKYLRQDGSWQVPPDTTYATTSNVTNGSTALVTSGGVYNQAPRFKDLGSRADYKRIVIGLCEISASASQGSGNFFSGQVITIRTNGLFNSKMAEIVVQDSYSVAKSCAYSLLTNFENTSTVAATGEGYRACVFTYGSKNYAGLEFYTTSSTYTCVMGTWTASFTPFAVIYYTQNTSTVENAEINNSINFTTTNNIRYDLVVDKAKNADKVNGLTVQTAVPAGALFTDHTYNFDGSTFYSGDGTHGIHDANAVNSNGIFYFTSNGPTQAQGWKAPDNTGFLINMYYSSTWSIQMAQDFYDNGALWIRSKSNNVWGTWKRIATIDDFGIAENTSF